MITGHRSSGVSASLGAFAVIAVLAVILPLVWMILTAFNLPRDIISPGWQFEFTTRNFEVLFESNSVLIRQFINSIVLTGITVAICLFLATCAAYSLSQLHWSKRTTYVLLGAAAILQIIPPMALVPGLYVTLQQFGLLGGITGLVFLNTVFNLPFAVLMMKVYFDGVPSEIREAGLVDGAGEGRILMLLEVPLVRAGLGAVGTFVAIMTWNEFLFGLTLTSGGSSAPVTLAVANLVQPYANTYGQMSALGSLTVIPILVFLAVANRQIVSGLTRGAVK